MHNLTKLSMFLCIKLIFDTLDQLFSIVSTVLCNFQSSILTSRWFLLFHGCTLHSLPFIFPWQRKRKRAAFSRSRRGGCRSGNSKNIVWAVRMQLGNSPTALRTLFCRVVVCSPPHIWHSGNSSPWKRPSLRLRTLASSLLFRPIF